VEPRGGGPSSIRALAVQVPTGGATSLAGAQHPDGTLDRSARHPGFPGSVCVDRPHPLALPRPVPGV